MLNAEIYGDKFINKIKNAGGLEKYLSNKLNKDVGDYADKFTYDADTIVSRDNNFKSTVMRKIV